MTTQKQGKFITLEGCEGVGKSTQIRLIKEYCEKNSITNVHFTREPGGTEIAEKIRKVILDPENHKMDCITELMLYCAARRQHTTEKIIPLINTGVHVFCDRYIDSTLAYQGYARGLDKSVIKNLNTLAMGGAKIDLTLFFDIGPEKGFLRKGGADKTDRLENESLEFHKRVYDGFKDILALEPSRIKAIDAGGSINEIHTQVISILKQNGIL